MSGVHSGKRYGILGGTFDPPHLGHLVLAQEMHTQLRLDRVWFVPTGVPPHKAARVISSADHRLAMLQRAVARDARFAIAPLELERPGPSYTVETLPRLRAEWGPAAWLCLILGLDMALDLPTWRRAAEVVAGVEAVAAAHRPGVVAAEADLAALRAALPGLHEKLTLVPVPQLDISATEVRERVASRLPIRYLVSDPVRSYIQRHRLYAQPSAAGATRPRTLRTNEKGDA